MTADRVKVTPAQRRYLEALDDESVEHPIRVLSRGSQWMVRRHLHDAGLISFESEAGGPRVGDNLTELGRAQVTALDRPAG